MLGKMNFNYFLNFLVYFYNFGEREGLGASDDTENYGVSSSEMLKSLLD